MSVEVSVLVSTKNRREQILNLLKKMTNIAQTPPWELIIIDNGSSDGTSEAIKSFNCSFPLVLLRQELPGKSRALNIGIENAKGNLLIFTDDDIVPDQNWISAMSQAASQNKGKDIFGGRVKVDSKLLPKWVADSHNLKCILASEHNFGDNMFVYSDGKYPIGPNMAVRKCLIDKNKGGWPVDLGPGTELPLGDERGFLESLGYGKENDRLYVANSIVWHIPEVEQLVFWHAVQRCYQGGFIHGWLDKKNEPTSKDLVLVGSLINARLRTCKSFKEFCCITIRAVGVVTGRFQGALKKLTI